MVTACVGGGSNALGIFSGFVETDAELVGVEPAGGAAVTWHTRSRTWVSVLLTSGRMGPGT